MGLFGKSGSKIHTDEELAKEVAQVEKDMEDACRHKPAKGRRCHDCLCTLIFLMFWVGMIGIAMVGFSKGKPERLLYGSDYNGVPCNGDQVIYYPRMNQDLVEASQNGVSFSKMSFYGICATECPEVGSWICNYDHKGPDDAHDPWYHSGPCWHVDLESSPIMFRCFPKKNETSVQVKHCVNTEKEVWYDPNSNKECNSISEAFVGGLNSVFKVNETASDIVLEGRTLKPGQCLHYKTDTKFGGAVVLEPNDFCTVTETITNTKSRGKPPRLFREKSCFREISRSLSYMHMILGIV